MKKANEVEIVDLALCQDKTPAEIAEETGLTVIEIQQYLENVRKQSAINSICESISDKVMKSKAPVLNAILNTNLGCLYEAMNQFYTNGAHLELDIDGLNKLAAITAKFSEITRLHEGKSTHNIAVQIQETNKSAEELIRELASKDEFVDYDIDED